MFEEKYQFSLELPAYLTSLGGGGSRLREDARVWAYENFTEDWLTVGSFVPVTDSNSPGITVILYAMEEVMLIMFKLRWFNTEQE